MELALGADAYMAKPFSTRDLMTRVNELLESESRKNKGGDTT
jgi:DNA-binding response OmpR family regulator